MPAYDILAIGNAIVDVLAHVGDDFLNTNAIAKGGMTLIDEARAEALYAAMPPATECSGGSAANTAAGVASLGGKAAYIGKVRDDELGEIFAHDMRSIGVAFDTSPAMEGKATARSFIMVTPDSQRSMNTYLGACTQVTPEDIDETLIAKAAVTYVEGYLWDDTHSKQAIRNAFASARKSGNRTAFTLSDTFCVSRHREDFLQLIASGQIDILFANEAEILALHNTDDFEKAVKYAKGSCPLVFITRSEKGAVVLTPEKRHDIPTRPVAKLVDTTGAGDLFAAGVLYALTHGQKPEEAAKLGNACAGHIITQLGARSATPLKTLAA